MPDADTPGLGDCHRGTRLFAVALALFALAGLLHCAAARAADPIPLQAGPMSMVFEPDNAFLRYLTVGPSEVLRGISAPIRNQFWGTVKPRVKIVRLDKHADHFTLTFDVTCRENELDFTWRGTIQGHTDGRVVYTFDGEAHSSFKRSRIGFCVLHGEDVAGSPWLIETTDGKKQRGEFPRRIAPHQPAKDIQAVSHEYAKGHWARVEFAGDTFEMEDQRNWTDASFKTYCTPLALPYPVEIAKGTRIQQTIALTLKGAVPNRPPDSRSPSAVTLTIGECVSKLPGIGLQVSSQADQLSPGELERLKALRLDHLRIDLDLAEELIASRLRYASEQARALGVQLLVGLRLGDAPEAELKRLAEACESIGPPVAVWLVNDSSRETFELACQTLKPRFPRALVSAGEDTNFTELNRKRPGWKGLEAVSYGMNPQVHAFDNASMIETLPIQAETVRSARAFIGKLPLMISPVTLRVRQATRPSLSGMPSANADPRQSSPFAAGWTMGSIKYLSEAGVNRITYYETVGWNGIMATDRASRNGQSPVKAELYPIYHVLKAVGEFAGADVRRVHSSAPRTIAAMTLRDENNERMMIANLTDRPQPVEVQGLNGSNAVALLQVVDPGRFDWRAETAPLSPNNSSLLLGPHGIAQLNRQSN